LSFFRLFVIIVRKAGLIVLNLISHSAYRYRFESSTYIVLLVSLIAAATSCSSGQAPLSIQMYNPKTHQALTCSARDQRPGSDASILAGAVESCARSLEGRGFIREK
jgi:hypothetical protein